MPVQIAFPQYRPEAVRQVMYVIMFVWLMVTGPGPHSVDHVIARKLDIEKRASL